jgi:hypothetical protein
VLAVACTGIASAATDVNPVSPPLEVTIDGGVTPKALSKTEYSPVALALAGSIQYRDAVPPQPPPLKELMIDAKNLAVDTTGYPTCTGGARQLRRDTEELRKACPDSIVGGGQVTVWVAYPENSPIPVKSPLLVFNGGTSGGTTTLYIHADLQPISRAIVATVKIKKDGSGIQAVATIPKIADGFGSVTDFSLKIDKKYTYKGKKVSVLSAKCIGGKIQANVVTKFFDGSQLQADVLRTCTSKP